MNEMNWMQQGWEYSECGAVMSPSTSCYITYRENKGSDISTVGVVTDYNFKVVPQSITGETDMLPKHSETPSGQ